MNLALFTFVVRYEEEAEILEIVDVVHCTSVSVNDGPRALLISDESYNVSLRVLDVGHIAQGSDIGAQFASPCFNFLSRAMSNCRIVGIRNRLLSTECTIGSGQQKY